MIDGGGWGALSAVGLIVLVIAAAYVWNTRWPGGPGAA